MSGLLDHDQLALWYRQAGHSTGMFATDRQWAIGDATGASVGTVFVDGDFLDPPEPDECLRWCSLAFLLVARERFRRDEAQAARARHRRRQRHHRH